MDKFKKSKDANPSLPIILGVTKNYFINKIGF